MDGSFDLEKEMADAMARLKSRPVATKGPLVWEVCVQVGKIIVNYSGWVWLDSVSTFFG